MVPVDSCVHTLFERQAAKTPDSVAVVHAGHTITYRELDQRANRLAHYLRGRGVGPDCLVGVCLERCIDLVVALLGTWKAGGAYVPLDPAYPKDRLGFMVGDAAPRVLLTQEKHRQLFPGDDTRIVCLDSVWPTIARESAQAPAAGASPSHLAYVMYTSGSTGRPKGAMIEHRGLANYLAWAIDAYRISEGGSVPVHSSMSFDLTVTSLYPALLVGAQIELLPDDVAAQSLLDALRRQKDRSLVKITPAHLDLLAQQLRPEEAAELTRLFVIGGENLTAESLRFWRTFAPRTRLINEYGPTETVVGCCIYEVQPGDPDHGSVPIGRAIANMQMHLLNEELRPVAAGLVGEIYIGGVGVARGYLNRRELTAQRFIDDPFSSEPGARLYRTGDLARLRPDGTLEYLGRVDDQVKIRGYRIELGEIEQTLAAHADVQACAVIAREQAAGERQLCAYVVARPRVFPGAPGVIAFLAQRLPAYMTPAHIVFLDSLPLTPNGKVDRKALQALAPRAAATQPAAAATTPTQAALLAIWRELLDVPTLGVDDDVFDLGAHSLMAMKAVVRIRDELRADVPLRNLFEHPSVAALAEIVDRLAWAAPAKPPAADAAREEIAL